MVDDDFNNKVIVISEQDAQTILDKQVDIASHIQSQGLGTVRTVFAVLAILATLAAAGITIPLLPMGTPTQVSNFNQAMNSSTAPRDLLVTTTGTATTQYVILIPLVGLFLLDAIHQLWGLMSLAQLQPRLGQSSTTNLPPLLASSELSALKEIKLNIMYITGLTG